MSTTTKLDAGVCSNIPWLVYFEEKTLYRSRAKRCTPR